ncbi:MAG: diaminopimelate decarboxylase [Deltaproteobacteria bacterium]|jgi:diaminopimelate decarboxylase|nr:diaminopimelate decarboxylase [Deltaproteobacteria bacterium]
MSLLAFNYRDNRLYVEDVAVTELAANLGTPLYVYSAGAIRANLAAYIEALAPKKGLVAYSVKAASNLAILGLVQKAGAGADIVSGGELYRAQTAGIEPQKIVFSGVGKTAAEMDAALAAGILMFNVESAAELTALAARARAVGIKAKVALRVNPDVDPQTHPYIATGFRESKFGVPIPEAVELYQLAASDPDLLVVGVDCHIGSQLTSLAPFSAAADRLLALLERLKDLGLNLNYLDVGGGLGINYKGEEVPEPAGLVKVFDPVLKAHPNLTLIMEPGRSIVGPAGILVFRVLYIKETPFKSFIIGDGAMNDLVRPSLYGSYHEIKPVNLKAAGPVKKVNVVGPVCESGDFLAVDRELPLIAPGELLVAWGAGAYGFSMSSNYNSRPRPAEVLVDGAIWRTIRSRETLADLIRGETA